jgi:hypothetical protein
MRRSAACLWVFALLLTSACPTAHRREGYSDRAQRADLKRRLKEEGCRNERYAEQCGLFLEELDEEELEQCFRECVQ